MRAKNHLGILGLEEILLGGRFLTLAKSLRMILTKMTTAATKITVDLD